MGSKQPQRYYCRCGTRLAKDNSGRQCASCERLSRDKLITPPEVPPEFWQTEQFREAFAAQHMSWVSRAYRTHPYHYAVYGPHGISQTLLGQWVGLRQPHVSQFETGPPIQHLDTLRHWARVLRIPAELLWFDMPGEKRQRKVTESAGSDPAVPPRNNVVELPALRWASDPAEARQAAVALWEYELEDFASEATDTTELSVLTLHWLVAPSDSPVFQGTGLTRVGLGDVRRVRDVRCQLKALDDGHGGGTAFPMAVTYLRREVVPLLRGRYDDSTGQILSTAIAEWMLDLGWMAYDAGAYALAWRYMVQALRLSHTVENRLFGGRVLAAMSHQALHLQYVPLAVDLIRAAREGTKHIAPPKAYAMLAAMEACAQAAYQRAESCATALQEAENALAATTQLQLGDVEAAAATGLLIISDAWRLHSSRVHSELAALVHTIESIGSIATKDFVEQGRDFLAARVR
ncbi:MAG: hypothetical protein LC775_01115 [Acidobacteria bacterium]|nr:hypothetical protein [Acidobacteriota bacterium]